MAESLSRKYFEDVYAALEDPWNFAESEYERTKYQETLGTLDRDRYGRALEIGCSIGVQTEMLAARCEHLTALDISEQALGKARLRCRQLRNVEFFRMAVPDEYPAGSFELTILSEVGYYLVRADLARLADRIAQQTVEKGELLLVHWLPFVPDYPLTGDEVHELFLGRNEWTRVASARREQFRIDLLRKRGQTGSPAQQ